MKENTAQRVSLTVRSDLLERIDAFADGNGMTRSGFMSLAATQYLNAVEAMPSVNKMLNAMAAVTEGVLKGEIEPSTAKAKMAAIQSTYEELTKK